MPSDAYWQEQPAQRARFYIQIDRLDEVLSALHRSGGWHSIKDVQPLMDRHRVCDRTLFRDLEMLANMGRVEKVERPNTTGKHQFFYRHAGPLFATDYS